MELLRHVLSVAIATSTSDKSLIENDGYQSRISNGAERSKEVRGIQVLVQLNQAENVICRFVHESQLYVATQLFVGQLGKILGNKDDCGFCKDTPIPTAVETTQLPKILPRQNLHVFGHRTRIQFVVLKQHTPPLPISFLSSPVYMVLLLRDVQVLRDVLF